MMGIIQELLTLWHNFKVIPPENVIAIQTYLEDERRKGKTGVINYNQLYNVGVILSRASEPVMMGEFSHLLAVPLSTATRIADWMVQHDYVQRVRDSRDRRIVRLDLTDKGRQLYDAINYFLRVRIEWVMRELSPAERESMLTLMHRLVEIFQQYDSDAA
jgi:DNA-binding MarR family transcriptional regulator